MSEHLEPVTVDDVRCVRETSQAICVVIDGEEIWIPKSCVDDDSEVYKPDTDGALVVAGWFAKKKGWE